MSPYTRHRKTTWLEMCRRKITRSRFLIEASNFCAAGCWCAPPSFLLPSSPSPLSHTPRRRCQSGRGNQHPITSVAAAAVAPEKQGHNNNNNNTAKIAAAAKTTTGPHFPEALSPPPGRLLFDPALSEDLPPPTVHMRCIQTPPGCAHVMFCTVAIVVMLHGPIHITIIRSTNNKRHNN